MGKMVLFLADGSTLDIPLDKARVTVGRRSSNDVCLPYAPVSAEHALFVIVPTGVVVEDLGSTNGTIVNGKRVARQFLHDGDRVEIGRQKFVYLADASATPDTQQRAPAVERRRPKHHPGESDAHSALDEAPAFAPARSIYGQPMPPPEPAPLPPESLSDAVVMPPEPTSKAWDAESDGGEPSTDYVALAASAGITFGGPAELPEPPAAPPPAPDPVPDGPHLKVIGGASEGRSLALTRDVSLVGRVGVRVAAVRRDNAGFSIAGAEGEGALAVNGKPVPPEGLRLSAGDVIAIAGVELELVVPEAAG